MVVATKKDRLFDSKVGEYRRSLKKQNIKHTVAQAMEQAEEHAEREVQERVRQIEEDLLSLEGGRFDACVAVSKGMSQLPAQTQPISTFSNSN